MSLVVEGVFAALPGACRSCCVEGGIAWAGPLMWSMDAAWSAMRDDVPHLDRRPSELFREHFWFTTQPIEEPDDPEQLVQALESAGMTDRIMFATDYPHWDFDAPAHDAAALGPQGAQGEDHGRQRLPALRLRLMRPPMQGAIDADVHVAPADIDALAEHMDDYWRDYLVNAGMRLSPHLSGSYPQSGPAPPSDVDALREQVLDPWGPSHAVLTCLTAFDASRNGYYDAALCSAINDWLRAEWLDRDDRVRAEPHDPHARPRPRGRGGRARRATTSASSACSSRSAARRAGATAASTTLHEAIAAQGPRRSPSTPGAAPGARRRRAASRHTYFEDYLRQLADRRPGAAAEPRLRGRLRARPGAARRPARGGFSWLPPLLWRFDKDWKAIWREVPWVKERPSEYVKRHVRAATAPAQLPADPQQAAQLAEMLDASDMLVFASDFPHEHGEGNLDALLEALDDAGREAVLRGNAAALYGLAG